MLELKGGIHVQDFVRIVVEALADGKITREELADIQHHFNKLSASDQEQVTRELSNSHTFQSNTLSLSTLQTALSHGTFEDFQSTIAHPGAHGYWGGGGGH